MKGIRLVFNEHKDNLSNIFNMAVKELKKEYSGTILGYFWGILKNLIFVSAYWFTIAIGLKGSKNVGYPYMAWLIAGLIGWFMIRDSLISGSKSIRKNKFLVTKMIFPVSTVPTYKILSNLISNLMFIPVAMIIIICSGVKINIHWIQFIYYEAALFFLLVGISWLTSALVVISKDIEILISSTVFVLFWVTPILFPASNISGGMSLFIKLNPFYYVIEGFRGTFLYGQWFWERPALSLYYWAVTGLFLVIGAWIHGRLRNQFVDVL